MFMNETVSQNFEKKCFEVKLQLNPLSTVILIFSLSFQNGSSYKETVAQYLRQYIKF